MTRICILPEKGKEVTFVWPPAKKTENDRNKRRNSLQIYYIMIYSLLAGAVAGRTNKDQTDRNFPQKKLCFFIQLNNLFQNRKRYVFRKTNRTNFISRLKVDNHPHQKFRPVNRPNADTKLVELRGGTSVFVTSVAVSVFGHR